MSLMDWFSGRVFKLVHGNNLVYNTCWEDPRLDRVALELTPSDNVMVITSAGCNALDYALTGPNSVHAVDMNPRQNALLELKLAAIRDLEYEDFYRMFGDGRLPGVVPIYEQKLLGQANQAIFRQRPPAVLLPRHFGGVRSDAEAVHGSRDPRPAGDR